MRVADKTAALLAVGLALAACDQGRQSGTADNAAITEIVALPPDESVETPTGEPVNGAAEPTNVDSVQPQERSE